MTEPLEFPNGSKASDVAFPRSTYPSPVIFRPNRRVTDHSHEHIRPSPIVIHNRHQHIFLLPGIRTTRRDDARLRTHNSTPCRGLPPTTVDSKPRDGASAAAADPPPRHRPPDSATVTWTDRTTRLVRHPHERTQVRTELAHTSEYRRQPASTAHDATRLIPTSEPESRRLRIRRRPQQAGQGTTAPHSVRQRHRRTSPPKEPQRHNSNRRKNIPDVRTHASGEPPASIRAGNRTIASGKTCNTRTRRSLRRSTRHRTRTPPDKYLRTSRPKSLTMSGKSASKSGNTVSRYSSFAPTMQPDDREYEQ